MAGLPQRQFGAQAFRVLLTTPAENRPVAVDNAGLGKAFQRIGNSPPFLAEPEFVRVGYQKPVEALADLTVGIGPRNALPTENEALLRRSQHSAVPN